MTKKQVHAVFDEIGFWEIYSADTRKQSLGLMTMIRIFFVSTLNFQKEADVLL